jgi:uncharacterized protein (TIGR02266 family)
VAADPKNPPVAEEKDKDEGASKRRNPRVRFAQKVRVIVPEDDTAIDLLSANVSKGGIFLRSSQPLPKGQKLELEFDVPTGRVRVEDCEVVWNRSEDGESSEADPPGMGVEFKSMSPQARQSIEAFIEEALEDAEAAAGDTTRSRMPLALMPPISTPPEDVPPREDSRDAAVVITPSQRAEPAFASALQGLPPDPIPLVPQAEKPPADGQDWLTLERMEEPPATPLPDPNPEEVPGQAMVELSTPPPPRTRALLFVLFVIVVAAATFITLYFIQPFGNGDQATDTIVAGPDGAPKLEASKPGVAKPEAPKPEVAQPEAPKPEVAKPEAPKPEIAQPEAPKPEVAKPEAPKPEVAQPEAPKPESPKPEVPKPEQLAAGQALVDLPVFEKGDSGWRMEISATGPVQWKTFTLKNPARLAVDALGAGFSGKRQALENPAPFVSRVRIGKQPDFIRFVLDFGASIPKHEIQKSPQKLVISFPVP